VLENRRGCGVRARPQRGSPIAKSLFVIHDRSARAITHLIPEVRP